MFAVHILAPSYHIIAGEGEEQGLTEEFEGIISVFVAIMFMFFGEKEIRYYRK